MRAPLLTCLTALPLVLATPALADVPRVAVDIAPVHALVAQVMEGVGAPDLVIPATASPHAYALRPSEAAALQGADLIIWVGPELTPWLSGALDTLAGDAARLGLLQVEGMRRLDFRQGASFEAHEHEGHDDHAEHKGHDAHDEHADHGHAEHAHEGHDHAEHAHEGHDHAGHDHAGHDAQKPEAHAGHDHAEHAHEDHDHEDHDHAEHAHEGHDHSGIDPHAWLDPVNAALWLDAIAAELSRLDPENAAVYGANAAAGQADLERLQADIAARMTPLSGAFVVFHDAYHYFEARFDIEAAGAISLSDAAAPGPARVAEIRDLVARQAVSCVFVEPQFNRGMVDAVFQGTEVNIGVIDPIGATLEPGAGLYAALIEGMAQSFESCLAPR